MIASSTRFNVGYDAITGIAGRSSTMREVLMARFFVVEARRDVAVLGPFSDREWALDLANSMNKQWHQCSGPRYLVLSLAEEEL